MHSGRIRTARSLPGLCSGGLCPGGIYPVGVSVQMGVCPDGCLSRRFLTQGALCSGGVSVRGGASDRDPLPPMNRMTDTPVKNVTLPQLRNKGILVECQQLARRPGKEELSV